MAVSRRRGGGTGRGGRAAAPARPRRRRPAAGPAGRRRVDAIIYGTGYKISFPFLDEDVIDVRDNEVALFHRVVDPDHPGLFFIGLVQPLGAIMPLAEAQSEWVADLLDGKAALPTPDEARPEIARYARRTAKRYLASKRHTIEVDFLAYLHEIKRERRHGAQRAARGRRPQPVPQRRV